MPRLSGYTVCRNAIRLDYPVDLAIRSMLPVCDEVVVCDSDSTDGTIEMLERMRDKEPKIRIINYHWPNPKGDAKWFVNWLNFTREHLSYDMQLELDADEVLDDSPECHKAIREAVEAEYCMTFDRLNFWRDPHSLIPEGHCCGKHVVRLGPAHYYMPSDEPHSAGECPILDERKTDNRLRIFHLGFIRRKDAFFEKAKIVLPAFFDSYDKRLERAESMGVPFWQEACDFLDKLVPYNEGYPRDVVPWLRARGYVP